MVKNINIEVADMKKILLGLIAFIFLCGSSYGACSCSHGGGGSCSHGASHGSSYSRSSGGNSSHDNVRLINTQYQKTEHKFTNCDKHYILTETATNFYSDGSRRIYSNSTIFNSDGSVIEIDCKSVEHLIFNDKHYFIINKNGYKLINDSGETLTKRNYSFMTKITPNRILVKFDKRYGIIDLSEDTIVPVKYQKMTHIGNGIFVTKLNGYYGILDKDDNILLNNNCERIKPIHDVIVIKKYGKYGIYNREDRLYLNPCMTKLKNSMNTYLLKKTKNTEYLIFTEIK